MSNISVVVNTLNEEENLPRCLASVRKIAGEIVVVDMNSSDRTVEIARKMGAKIYFHDKSGYVEPARNFAISKARGEWILILDADEVVPGGLGLKLIKISTNPSGDYYRLPRKNIIFGKWIKHSRWWPDHNIRFFRKGSVSWNEVIHSVPLTKGKGVDLEAKESYALVHYHYKNVEEYITRLNRYTSLHAKLMTQDGYEFTWKDLVTKPTGEFLSRYFQGEGYKDGIHGLALAGLQGFSEFVMYLKIWQNGKFKSGNADVENVISEMKNMNKEFNYWHADTLLKTGGNMVQRVRRKFKV